jgi:hypothetical protein
LTMAASTQITRIALVPPGLGGCGVRSRAECVPVVYRDAKSPLGMPAYEVGRQRSDSGPTVGVATKGRATRLSTQRWQRWGRRIFAPSGENTRRTEQGRRHCRVRLSYSTPSHRPTSMLPSLKMDNATLPSNYI